MRVLKKKFFEVLRKTKKVRQNAYKKVRIIFFATAAIKQRHFPLSKKYKKNTYEEQHNHPLG